MLCNSVRAVFVGVQFTYVGPRKVIVRLEVDRDDPSGRVKTSEIHSDAVHWAHGVSASSVEEFRFDSLILVSFFFELLSQFLSMRQVICDLDVMSFLILVSFTSGLLISFRGVSFNDVNLVELPNRHKFVFSCAISRSA